MSSNNRNYATRSQSSRFSLANQFVPGGNLLGGGGATSDGDGGGAIADLNFFNLYQPTGATDQNELHQQIFTLDNSTAASPMHEDVVMKSESQVGAAAGGAPRPHWMKSKLPGVKKISTRERRRRQNEQLRRLLTPKNALMVLNEMRPGEQVANQFKVEPTAPTSFYTTPNVTFCADLTLEGQTYKGYGENKLSARNAAAEQAIRDLILKRMAKHLVETEAKAATGADAGADGAGAEGAGGDEEALPMIQLASFALHKLFSEWEYEGHRVPLLKSTPAAAAGSGPDGAAAPGSGPGPGPAAPPKKERVLPAHASSMHPSMLLTYMRPGLEYRELGTEGDRPQNMTFTLGVDVDGATYIGKASNKKEARRMAARAACQALFGVVFDEPQPK